MYSIHDEGTADRFDDLSLAELRQRGNAKWTYFGDEVLPAWVAEMDFPVARVIREALHHAVEYSRTGYSPKPEATGLPRACAAWLSRRFGLEVEPDQVRMLPNVLRGVTLAIEVFSPPDSGVVVMTPAYPPFFEIVRVTKRQIVEVPMRYDQNRFTFDLDGIDAALGAGAATVILCNPNNPLGRSFSRDELVALSDLVEAHGARVVVDEAHAPLSYPETMHISYATVSPSAAKHSVTVTSASKGWNIPGLSCAQVILTNEADTRSWDALSVLRTHGASVLGILANRIAYEEGEAWLNEAVAYLDRNRLHLSQLLTTYLPAVKFKMPSATYLAWLDCTALGLDNPTAFFLQHAKVALTDGASFGAPGRGHVRFNFATSQAIITAIVQRMAEAVQAMPAPAP